ncbi:sarcotoxin-1A-like [Cochliomyia hominivorax]
MNYFNIFVFITVLLAIFAGQSEAGIKTKLENTKEKVSNTVQNVKEKIGSKFRSNTV